MNILALEFSTTSAKAMLYNTMTGTFAVKTRAYVFEKGAKAGRQDSRVVFETSMAVGREIAAGKQIDAIALGCTWHSIMLCDQEMRQVTPLLQWTYTGASEICKALRQDEAYTLRYYHKTGCMVNATYPMFKLLLLRQTGWALEQYKISDQGSYTMYRLTGRHRISDITVAGAGLLNTHKRDYDDELLGELGITRDHLPELVPYHAALPLTPEGAALLGIEAGIPVLPALADGAMNHVGAGALAPGVMSFSMGTSAGMRLSAPKPILPATPSTWCYLTPTAWLSGAATAGCTSCVDWSKAQLFGANITYAEAEAGYKHTDKPAVFLPFLFGERCPGWQDERMGGFYDLWPQHSAYDLYNSVLEGVLFNLYQCYGLLTDLNGAPHRIRLSGGVRHSDYWTQMCADIFGRPLELDPATQASLMGIVVVAMEKLGVINNLLDMEFPASQVIHPNPDKVEMYRARYARYLYWYDRSI
ncbi:MAG: FGGY-family carbohydrate kinase [Oscillospiraceae bacterium]|nr:FGGY-family carbohydrate kinase [Oscillospiraceae bacterium]